MRLLDRTEWLRKWRSVVDSQYWKEFRRYMFEKVGYRCQRCGDRYWAGALRLHHLNYKRLGHERESDVQVVCKWCHDEADREREETNRQKMFRKRLNGWATKVYGSDWRDYDDDGSITEAFSIWLEEKGLDY